MAGKLILCRHGQSEWNLKNLFTGWHDVDLTEKGVGLGIEAGYACAKGIPIVIVAQQGSDISATLQGISQQVIFYQQFNELAQIRIN